MINIPDPCKEDFNKMTPTERGAFCEKCQTDTFDFRNLSINEINQIVHDNKGKQICGRFYNHQLDQLNNDFASWKNQSSKIFRSKFILACLLVFGLGLFSCNQEEATQIDQILQKNVTEHTPKEFNSDRSEKYVNRESTIVNLDLTEYVENHNENEVECELKETAGEVVDLGQVELSKNENHNYTTILGMIAISEDYEVYRDSVSNDSTDNSILAEPIQSNPDHFEATAFPNPTNSQSTIALDIKEKGKFDIQLFDLNGRIIQQIYTGNLPIGQKQFEVDLTDQESGMYIVNVISSAQKETLKIQKL